MTYTFTFTYMYKKLRNFLSNTLIIFVMTYLLLPLLLMITMDCCKIVLEFSLSIHDSMAQRSCYVMRHLAVAVMS